MRRFISNAFQPRGRGKETISKIPTTRVPQDFIDAMRRIAGPSDMTAETQPAQKAPSSVDKWKSSFKPIGEEDGDSQDQSTSYKEKPGLYDPYEPLSSDSESEMPQDQDHNLSPPIDDNDGEHQCFSPVRGCPDDQHWDSSYSKPGSGPLDRDFSTGTRPAEIPGLSPVIRQPEEQIYNPEAESLHCFGSLGEPVDQRGGSPDRLIHASSTFPTPFGQRTNGEKITLPEYKLETIRLSPPRLQDYHHKAWTETCHPQRTSIFCDLCEVELASGQELQDHLDSKCHWDTLEHIQQNNKYDDLIIAFLQEVMLYKSHHCSQAVEDSTLQTLQENHHLTKVEMFHCAACKVYISTSVAEVQAHITSEEHIFCTKEFEVHQRHACLSKAEAMMKELKPQFEHFLKGGSPFE
ncbi:uncharacterized protein LOC115795631 isoform X2 [Archocentrus centrarchus]|uniref:uncharacterized protein LOC115795631 isoform X2 n=1 Tax=Archocentrus centrarchus TaxID=63155 RepID=UPI0011EA1449|nr:DBIRD complex subunit ZNF326 isoform X2 [Archocentrus centrarchus]